MVSKNLIKELQQILTEYYGIDLELQEVSEIGNTLVDYFETLARADLNSKGAQNG